MRLLDTVAIQSATLTFDFERRISSFERCEVDGARRPFVASLPECGGRRRLSALSRIGAVDQPDQVETLTSGQWRSWLRRRHTRSDGVGVVFFKRSPGRANVDYEEPVCEALCWGWIDSKVGRVDEERTRLWFSPRRPDSKWSQSNVRRVELLREEGKMHPAGECAVLAAKRSGLWPVSNAGGP